MPLYQGWSTTDRPLDATLVTIAYRARRDEPFDEWYVILSDAPHGVETPYAVVRLDRRLRFAYEGSQRVGAPIEIGAGTAVHWLDDKDVAMREVVVSKLTYWHRELDTDAYVVEAVTACGQTIEFAALVTDTRHVAQLRISRDTGEPVSVPIGLGVQSKEVQACPAKP